MDFIRKLYCLRNPNSGQKKIKPVTDDPRKETLKLLTLSK